VNWLLAIACATASIPAGLRWLRVAQREHYLPGSVNRFQWRWWRSSPMNNAIDLVATVGVIGSVFDPRWGFLVAIAQIGPVGLPVRGVTSPLAWTNRLGRVASVTGVILLVGFVGGVLTDLPIVIVGPLYSLPLMVDIALRALRPYEKRQGDRWVDRAAAKLRSTGADVVAITGSYGKTTTKNYVTHLLGGSTRVMASPASFNNRMGLARAINENLTADTEVFVAEMGTFGPGEIAELCRWIPPKVAAIVSIGPVHLERFRTLENIVRSKSEILDRASTGVICTDQPLLAELAEQRRGTMQLIVVSGRDGIVIGDDRIMTVPEGVFGANLAVALGICRALGIDLDEVISRVSTLPTSEHRQSISTGAAGFTIIDDTFNSNPAGASSALDLLTEVGAGGRTAVVTPGMVELGPVQNEQNRAFAQDAAAMVDHLVVVGKTNRRALTEGSANRKASVTVVDSRDEAVAWARANLGPGDAVLYENDLPDHYP